jgi:predicted RNase H-like HicB family nuclease
MKKIKFVVEKHRDGYVAYPLGLEGAVVGQGESYESALADAKSAAAFHIESFGKEAFDDHAALRLGRRRLTRMIQNVRTSR